MSSSSAVLINSRKKGIILVLIGAILWGVSGTVAQFLFQHQGFSPEWLVVIRLLISGTLLLGIAYKREKHRIWGIWRVKHDAFSIILFGILGMLAVQYTFFAAIHHGNAATATVLQYLAPVLIMCYSAFRAKRMPTLIEGIALIFAISGTFLLVTRGSLHTLSISGLALFWGLTSAVALAYYTLQPLKLLANWGSTIVVGWGMLIGGIFFSFIHPPWDFVGEWTLPSVFAVIFIVAFGTIIAFYCYLESLKYISASDTSLLACAEPLTAAFLAIVWLHVTFGFAEWLGTICILSTIALLSVKKEKSTLMVSEKVEYKVNQS
ncbi:EamA family transporter [Bacillus sp. DTU_2020_1000418_1_SI_GHA_SEK_038]|uniref:DMT family transporter n=1 Tax=Bacillus sp. DTU_2020_1000418_1_SI_GHA_SEK_038 TaxID=3077585 RepID=UPI0028EF13BF|nr:EamA family transporter [Bacillus sp. DTU_2020_1000418_1_SI_GHA_SEK_038]WNS74896.1 EamA family transporter [Bacillus sp. DTU_2020_1000418_1_SI_GHA_SEK_038]